VDILILLGGVGEVTIDLEITNSTHRTVIATAAKEAAVSKWGDFTNSRADIDHGRFNVHFVALLCPDLLFLTLLTSSSSIEFNVLNSGFLLS
jgi:hypothetical protein